MLNKSSSTLLQTHLSSDKQKHEHTQQLHAQYDVDTSNSETDKVSNSTTSVYTGTHYKTN